MKKVFYINGGAGRVLCSIPALLKYKKLHGDEFYVISESGIEFFIGVQELQDLCFDPNHKGIWESIIRPNEIVSVEPYREHGYYNQKRSLTEAFDKIINNTDDHSDLPKSKIVLNQEEEISALDAIESAKSYHKKKKTVVFQPFGRSSKIHKSGHAYDPSARSLSTDDYFQISNKIREKYNCIVFTEHRFENDGNVYVQAPNLRVWAAIVEAADYFLGIDSVGQHMANIFNKPGTVILGSTFAENITYSEHFNIVEKKDTPKVYSPIRIEGIDGELINRINDKCMDFSKKELGEISNNIMRHIKQKIGS